MGSCENWQQGSSPSRSQWEARAHGSRELKSDGQLVRTMAGGTGQHAERPAGRMELRVRETAGAPGA